VWPASDQSETLPSDTQAFLADGAYDWIFYRFPANGESYCANTNATASPNASRFPVDADGRLGCSGGASSGDCTCEPWAVLMEHEWLHAVVAFYQPRLGWPTPDVHGACAHGYGTNCNTDEHYFADILQGKVVENGTMLGITPDEWGLQGTPAHPIIKSFSWQLTAVPGGARLTMPDDLDQPVTVQVLNPQAEVVTSLTGQQRTFDLPIPPGRWSICLSNPGSEHYRAARGCAAVTVYPVASPIGASTPTPTQGTVIGTSTGGSASLIVSKSFSILRKSRHRLSVTYDPADKANHKSKRTFVLIAVRGKQRVQVTGARNEGRVNFHIDLPRGSWRLHIQVTGPSGITLNTHAVTVRIR
jgi:hypothetical protein